MFKFVAVVLMGLATSTLAKPGIVAPVAYSAPLFAAAAPVVTATSSQVVSRNYNGLAAAPLIAAPVAYAAAAPFAYTAAPLAYSAPFARSVYAPTAYAGHVAAPYVAAPYAAAPYAAAPYAAAPYASFAPAPFAAPLKYTAAPVLL